MFTQSALLPIFFTMVADTTDYGKWKTGKNVRAINYGFYTFSQKMGMAFSGTIVGALLDVVGYVANQEQTASTILGIKAIYCLLPAAICLGMSILGVFWKLNEGTMKQIVSELNEREKETANA